MRVLIQRVSSASVKIDGDIKGEIAQGVLLLLGIENEDTEQDIDWLCGKISRMRIFPDENGVMNLDVNSVNGEALVISQFTLHASTKKGNRPSYIKAARPEVAIPLYNQFVAKLGEYIPTEIKTGEFGADMKVSLVNDGPVTIWLDSKNKE